MASTVNLMRRDPDPEAVHTVHLKVRIEEVPQTTAILIVEEWNDPPSSGTPTLRLSVV
jgi:hypothetical protein